MRGLSCFTFISLFLVASVVADSPFDFRQWTMEGPSANGNWIINDKDGDGVFEQVTQTTNGNITFFVSPNQIGPGNEFKGSFSASSGDDDYIGFVFGFQDASNYYVMQWKQGNQADSGWGNAAAGITILKIRDLDPALDSSNAALWKAVDDAHVKVLSAWTTATGNGVGFQDGVTYNFHLVIQATSVQVRITRSDDGSLVYDSGQVPVDEAVTGRFGFYNLSEEYVVYKGFTFAELPTPTPTPTPRASSTERRTISLPNLPTGARPLEMQLIPAGQFQMGSPDSEPDAGADEMPAHGVTLTQPFYIGKYEVTQAQWTAVMGSAPTNTQDGQGPNLPVYDVDPAAIQSFLDKLNTLGIGIFRLPTEAEWEYACRADTTTRFYWGDDPDYTVVDTYAWTSGINQGPAEVGGKKPNPWGLFDMSGNVWEMCQDWYGSYSSGAVIDPLGLGSGDYKVLRGGSWIHDPWQARSARRAVPSGGFRDVGFRIALTPSQQATPTPIPGGPVDGNLIYSNDFETDDARGWSASSFTVSPNGARRFLGEFGNESVTLNLDNLPSHRSVTLSFDLLILKSWDGMGYDGPDRWDLTVDDSLVLLHTTFDNITTDPNKSQNYPDAYPGPSHPARTGAAEQDTLGYSYFWGDSTYRLSYTFPHGASSLQLAFTGMNLQGVSDESWGLDDVRVWVSNQYVGPIEPTPTPTPTPQPIVYSAEITEVDVQTAPAGTPVTLRGTAFWLENNSAAANVPVAVRVQRQGVTRFLTAVSDGAGQFSVVFTPLAGEAGRYSVNANHPQLIEVDDIPQKEFILVGMRSEPRDAQAHLIPYQPQERTFAVINLGDTPLSGLTARVEGAPANLQATVQIPAELPANGRVDAVLNLTALDNSTPEANFTVLMQSAEGAKVTVPVAVTIAPGTPRLSANPGTLQSGMVRGQKTLVECMITNTGGAVAKNVQVMLPQATWLSLVSSSRLGDLAPGQSGTIVLSLQPSPTQKLGLSSGTMIVYGEQVDVSVPFQFNTISDAVGDLLVWVEDEYTYYAAGSPRVQDATITLKNNLGEIVAEVGTDETGSALISPVKEGNYYLQVWAPKHNTYNGTVQIVPGKVNEVRALLPRDLVTYRWKVVPTLIQDHYEFTVESVFETNVPVPVVTVDPPVFNLDSIEGDSYQLNLTVTNHGLIAAEDINLEIGTHPLFEMTLPTTHLDSLAANSSVVVPVSIRRIQTAGKMQPRAEVESPDPCVRTFFLTRYSYQCGDDHIMRQVPVTIYYFNINVCGCQGPMCGVPAVAVTGGGGPTGGGYTGPGVPGLVQEEFVVGNGVPCNPCLMAMGEATIDCFIEKIILKALGVTDIGKCGWKTLKGTYKGFSTCWDQGLGWKCLKEISKSTGDIAAACGKAAGSTISKPLLLIWDIVKCGDKLLTAYQKKCSGSAAKIAVGGRMGHTFYPSSAYPSMDTAMVEFEQDLNDLRSVMDALIEFFGDPIWIQVYPEESDSLSAWLEQFDAFIAESSADGEAIASTEQATLLAMALPSTLTVEDAQAFLDRWNRSLTYWKANWFEVDDLPNGSDPNFIVQSRLLAAWQAIDAAVEYNESLGNEEFFGAIQKSYQKVQTAYEKAMGNEEEGVCARVRICIEQEAVMTRSAFSAILELDNNSDITMLENVSVEIKIQDAMGDLQNERFGIREPILTGIASMDGSGSVLPKTTARAEWILIPAMDAAPEGPTQYFVGGSLHYRMDGNNVTVPLFPDAITVMPDPRLVVKYFHQKEVYSDDPFTTEVEPAEPFSLGLMMTNIGKGIARDMQITSSQPQIVDNEKGLLIDFSIIGTQVGGEAMTPSLKVNLGDIEPGKSAVATWLMVSSLQGKFVEYQASYQHVDGMNNPKLSLIDRVEIHELIHSIRVDQPQDDGLPDFLVNDVPDDNFLPDTIHGSDGSLLPVQVVQTAQVNGSPRQDMVEMKVKATMPQGWVYLRIEDPAANQHTLYQVLREDGSEVRFGDNAWTTHRLKRPKGQAAYNEDYLHIVDYRPAAKETTYTVVYQPGKVVPTATPTPEGTPLPTPVEYTPTPTPNWTPTPTHGGGTGTPRPTATPGMSDEIQPTDLYEFHLPTLDDNGWEEMPGGFPGGPGGEVTLVDLASGLFASSTDRKGLSVKVDAGEVHFLYAQLPTDTRGHPVLIRVLFRADGDGAQIFLGALKGGLFEETIWLDGSIAYLLDVSSADFAEQEKRYTTVYEPDMGTWITPYLQVVGAQGSTQVWIDRVELFLLEPGIGYPGSLFSE